MDSFLKIFSNRIFLSTLLAWAIAQTIKVILGVIREKKFNFKWFVGTGGMPSSHSAGVAAMATSVGIKCGFSSTLFAFSLIFAIITMFDAQGVRRASGKQAEALNKIFEDMYFKKPIKEERLIELIGHTPVEVITGGLIGILLAILMS